MTATKGVPHNKTKTKIYPAKHSIMPGGIFIFSYQHIVYALNLQLKQCSVNFHHFCHIKFYIALVKQSLLAFFYT